MTDDFKVPEAFHESDQPTPEAPIVGDIVNLSGNVSAVEAREVNVQNGGIGALKGEVVTATLNQGGIGAMAAKRADVHLTNGGIGALAAVEATVSDGAPISVLAAVTVNGNPKVLFDVRAGLLAGVVAGSVFGLISLLGRRSKRA